MPQNINVIISPYFLAPFSCNGRKFRQMVDYGPWQPENLRETIITSKKPWPCSFETKRPSYIKLPEAIKNGLRFSAAAMSSSARVTSGSARMRNGRARATNDSMGSRSASHVSRLFSFSYQ